MKSIVAIKSVPDSAARIRLSNAADQGGLEGSLDLAGVKFVPSPYDEMALEQALRLREAGSGEVLAVSLGGDQVPAVLRSALAMGADRAVHLQADAPSGLELDGFQTASALAAFLAEESFDLFLCGRLAIDDQSAQVATIAACLLGVPIVNEVTAIEAGDGPVRLERTIDGRSEVLECATPLAATAEKGLAEARRPSMKSIMAAKKKQIETVPAVIPPATLEALALEPPPERPPGRIVGSGAEAVPELIRLLREEAKVL